MTSDRCLDGCMTETARWLPGEEHVSEPSSGCGADQESQERWSGEARARREEISERCRRGLEGRARSLTSILSVTLNLSFPEPGYLGQPHTSCFRAHGREGQAFYWEARKDKGRKLELPRGLVGRGFCRPCSVWLPRGCLPSGLRWPRGRGCFRRPEGRGR